MSLAPLRRITSFNLWSGHGPVDAWATQAYWFSYELECGHTAHSARIPAASDWNAPYTTPRVKRVRCKACLRHSENR